MFKEMTVFVDAHLHTVRKKGLPRNAADSNYTTPEELIVMMDHTGVDRGILLPLISPESSFQLSTTEDVLEVCESYPDRFYPFCNVDPRAGAHTPDADLSFHLNFYKHQGCLGVGELTASLEFTDPLVQNLFHHCERCEMPVLFHLAPQRYGNYGLIDKLGLSGLEASLQAFPNLIFIGHSSAFWSEISGAVNDEKRNQYPSGPVEAGGAVPRLMANYRNLYCGWDATSGFNGLTRDPEFGWSFMERFKDRILFGTDICDPLVPHRHADYLRTSFGEGRISREAFENISWRNANRPFALGL